MNKNYLQIVFTLQRFPKAKLVKGTRGEVYFLISRKVAVHNLTQVKEKVTKPRKSLG